MRKVINSKSNITIEIVMQFKWLKIIFMSFTIFMFSSNSYADLFEQYMNNETTKARSEMSYGFGVNMPPLYKSGGGKVIDLQFRTDKGGVCGEFDLFGELKAVFNKEVLDQYVQGLAGAIVSGAPLLLLCYSSQTRCDLYKHFRNMANFAATLRNAQCHEIEKLAMNTGLALRKLDTLIGAPGFWMFGNAFYIIAAYALNSFHTSISNMPILDFLINFVLEQKQKLMMPCLSLL